MSAATATYAKLRDGTWGVRVPGTVRPGDRLTVVKRSGEAKTETVAAIVHAGDGFTLATIAGRSAPASQTRAPRPSTRRSRPRYSRAQRDCEDCLSVGPCGPDCEYAHIFRQR